MTTIKMSMATKIFISQGQPTQKYKPDTQIKRNKIHVLVVGDTDTNLAITPILVLFLSVSIFNTISRYSDTIPYIMCHVCMCTSWRTFVSFCLAVSHTSSFYMHVHVCVHLEETLCLAIHPHLVSYHNILIWAIPVAKVPISYHFLSCWYRPSLTGTYNVINILWAQAYFR